MFLVHEETDARCCKKWAPVSQEAHICLQSTKSFFVVRKSPKHAAPPEKRLPGTQQTSQVGLSCPALGDGRGVYS